jgi:cobalt/nickel transport system permease protein
VFRRLMPPTRSGFAAAAGLACGVTVPLSAVAFSLEWLFGASAPVPFNRVFAAMVGVHSLIGVGEAMISGLAVGAVVASRPDLVAAASGLDLGVPVGAAPVGVGVRWRTFALAVLAVIAIMAAIVSQFAASSPDGLERVAAEEGFLDRGGDHDLADMPFADYATRGIDNPRVSLAVAGVSGAMLTLLVGGGIVVAGRAARGRRAVCATGRT